MCLSSTLSQNSRVRISSYRRLEKANSHGRTHIRVVSVFKCFSIVWVESFYPIHKPRNRSRKRIPGVSIHPLQTPCLPRCVEMRRVMWRTLRSKCFGFLTDQPTMIPRQTSELRCSKQRGQPAKFVFRHLAVKPFSRDEGQRAHNSIFAITRNGDTYVTHIPLLDNSRIVIGKPSHHIGVRGTVSLLSDPNGRSDNKRCCKQHFWATMHGGNLQRASSESLA